jgi:hypothetical protein
MGTLIFDQEHIVTMNFFESLLAIKDDQFKVLVISQMYFRKVFESLSRKEFVVKIFPFDTKEDVNNFFGKDKEYRNAGIEELLPFVVQFPEFKKIPLAALGSFAPLGGGDAVSPTSVTRKEEWILQCECFKSCCIEKTFKKGFHNFLGVKNQQV